MIVYSGRTLILDSLLFPKHDDEENVCLTTMDHANLKKACKILILELVRCQKINVLLYCTVWFSIKRHTQTSDLIDKFDNFTYSYCNLRALKAFENAYSTYSTNQRKLPLFYLQTILLSPFHDFACSDWKSFNALHNFIS